MSVISMRALKTPATAVLGVTLACGLTLRASANETATIATTASVYMYSQAGNYVGGALGTQQVDWVQGAGGVFTAATVYDNAIDIVYDDAGTLWSFFFAAPSNDPAMDTHSRKLLHDGLYTNAERYPYDWKTLPGLSVAGNWRWDYMDSGWFDVLDVEYNPNGTLASFAVDFKQYDNATQTGPALYGSLRFNSSIGVDPVPLPGTLGLLVAGALCALLIVNPRGGRAGAPQPHYLG